MLKKILLLILLCFTPTLFAAPLHIVAAENVYGNIAAQLGGDYVQVTNILNNPKQDPHLFSTTPAIAKAIANANLIIYNGLDYDSWMENLISAHSKKIPTLIVANLAQKKTGDNPHIWYDPTIIMTYAIYLTKQLSSLDPAHKDYFLNQLMLFKNKHQQLMTQIHQDKIKFKQVPVIATEPIFNDMADALGLIMLGRALQLNVMNDTEPSATAIKEFQNELTSRRARVFISNNQVSDPLTQHMQQIAEQNTIPCISVSEMQPPNEDYFTWMQTQLTALEKALGG